MPTFTWHIHNYIKVIKVLKKRNDNDIIKLYLISVVIELNTTKANIIKILSTIRKKIKLTTRIKTDKKEK